MYVKEQGGQRRKPVGRPELPPWQPILKEYAMSVEKDLTPRKNSVSEQKKKRRFFIPREKIPNIFRIPDR